MATDNLDAVDLSNVEEGGLIFEDVMDRIYNIDPEDRPFIDSIQSDDADNQYKEFVHEVLAQADPNNAFVDGQSLATTENRAKTGQRYGNYCQSQVLKVSVSERAREVNSIGTNDQALWQIFRRQKELRRDQESAYVGVNGAQPGDGNEANLDTTGPGVMAGLASWIRTNVDRGVNGANAVLSGSGGLGGYPKTTGNPPTSRAEWIGITPGQARALAFSMINDQMESAWIQGGYPRLLQSTPKMIRQISTFLFSATAQIATLQTYTPQGNRTGAGSEGGISGGGVTAQASVNVLVTDYGTLELVPNRFQKTYQSSDAGPVPVVNVFLIDPDWFSASYLKGFHVKPLAKTGLAENMYVRVDSTVCAMAENGSACIADIDPTLAMTA